MVNLNMAQIHVKRVKISILLWDPWDCMVRLFKKFKFYPEILIDIWYRIYITEHSYEKRYKYP